MGVTVVAGMFAVCFGLTACTSTADVGAGDASGHSNPASHPARVNHVTPRGQREWTHSGLAIYTPHDYSRNAITCTTPVHNTVIIEPGPEATCAFPRPAGITSVEFNDYTPDRPGPERLPEAKTVPRQIEGVAAFQRVGTSMLALASGTPLTVVETRVPSLGVEITIASSSPQIARRLANTLHLATS